jgi:2-polyprenyl-3-methyl-5-hydroxy-6-metoxy-1,4-benzoquinol methylase
MYKQGPLPMKNAVPDGELGNAPFRDLERVASDLDIPPENLIRGFAVEREFHAAVLAEEDSRKRKELYWAVYEAVHPLYELPSSAGSNPKDPVVRLFRKELEGRSILEVGCGNGLFLKSVARQLRHGRLVGIDVSTSVLPECGEEITFLQGEVTDFTVPEQFDVVFSEHVIEHLAPADLPLHIRSLRRALTPGGVLIVCAPNRLFGPSDITRIVDYSQSGRTAAAGTHLHEPLHGELTAILREYGFSSFRTIFPLMKIRNRLPWVRFDARLMEAVERSRFLLGLLRKVRLGGRCIARFDTVLICRGG